VKDLFNCRHRGKIGIGGNVSMDMYFVKSIRKEYSENPGGTIPNNAFMNIYASIKEGIRPGDITLAGCSGRDT
jgi:hypothetical protein